MKKLLWILALLLFPLAAQAQRPGAKAFREATDSLQQRLKRRTSVDTPLKLEKVTVRGSVLDFYFSQELSDYPWRKEDVPWFREQLQTLGKAQLGSYSIGNIYAKRQNLKELPMPPLTRDGKPSPTALKVADPRGNTVPLVQGADNWPQGLSGRHIALWQSHGRYWEAKTDRWEWQRSATHRTMEDLFTQSFVLPFLIPMLENAGAVVITPRERDPQPYEVVCDNDPSFGEERTGLLRRQGYYVEQGHWQDAGEGFADRKPVYLMYENPFRMGSARQTATTTGEESASIIWRADIPEKGNYAVYVSYKTLPESTTDARYTVHHLGGSTLLHVNQTMGGGTWVYLGTFLFDKGEKGYVSLSNKSASNGKIVSADAVRFGGGMGKMERGGTLSGMPAYVEGALYQMQWNGVEMNLFDDWDNDYTKDFAGRGKWVQEISGGSRVNPSAPGRRIPIDLSLAFHTDAGITPNDSIVGTLAIYTLKADNSDIYANGESRMNGRLLSDLVQTQVVEDIRALYEPLWSRRQTWDRSYSESRTTGVPGMLLELLSHQNFADMRYGLDPTFRFSVCRAVYKGVLKYLSARYDSPYVVQPLPVHAFRARLQDGKAVLSWSASPDPMEPTAKADYYRVYTRLDDGGFDAGMQIQDTTCTLPVQPGHVYSFRVEACNSGGRSFPSEILAVGMPAGAAAGGAAASSAAGGGAASGRVASGAAGGGVASGRAGGVKKVLIVNNFTRLSAPTWFDTPTYAGFLDNQDSGVPLGTDILYAGSVNQFDRSAQWTDDDNPGFGGSYTDQGGTRIAGNTFDYPAMHGRILLRAGYSFDSSSAEAFAMSAASATPPGSSGSAVNTSTASATSNTSNTSTGNTSASSPGTSTSSSGSAVNTSTASATSNSSTVNTSAVISSAGSPGTSTSSSGSTASATSNTSTGNTSPGTSTGGASAWESDAQVLDLICGKQVTTRVGRGAVPDRYTVFPEALQAAITRFTQAGGSVILSGSYIATDAWSHVYPVPLAPDSTRKFIQETLGYKWVTNFGDISGKADSPSTSPIRLPAISYNRQWSEHIYRVESPDGLEPASAQTRALLRYSGTRITAATLFEPGSYRVAAFGFPLETSPQFPDILTATLRYLTRP